MTLLVGLVANDGIVMAADSRGTFGDPRGITAQNDAQQKANILSPKVAALVAGTGALGDLVLDEVKVLVAQAGEVTATPVMNVLRSTVKARYDDWFRSVPAIQPQQLAATGQVAQRPDLAFVVGGHEVDGMPRLFQLASQFDFAPMVVNHGFAVAGVAQYALYLLNRLYQKNRSLSDLTALAVYVITETASQDGKVGGPVRVVVLRPDSDAEMLSPEAVVGIDSENASRATALRDSFYRQEVINLAESKDDSLIAAQP
jgi:20S proteasome alpha/beta subunit